MTKITTFILGAGASCPYGYPTAVKLLDDIANNMDNEIFLPCLTSFEEDNIGVRPNYNSTKTCYDFEHFAKKIENLGDSFELNDEDLLKLSPVEAGSNNPKIYSHPGRNGEYWAKIKIKQIMQFKDLGKKLEAVGRGSIDVFLRDNCKHSKYGKIMIQYSLLKKEKIGEDVYDDWYKLFFDHLTADVDDPEDILLAPLNIITFNYDLSLDYRLMKMVKETQRFANVHEKFCSKFLKERLVHVHGQLYSYDMDTFEYGKCQEIFGGLDKMAVRNTNRFLKSNRHADNIFLMQDPNADGEGVHYRKIERFIRDANELIVIGYSFSKDNKGKIAWPWHLSGKEKNVKYMDYKTERPNVVREFEVSKKENKSFDFQRIVCESISDAYQNCFRQI